MLSLKFNEVKLLSINIENIKRSASKLLLCYSYLVRKLVQILLEPRDSYQLPKMRKDTVMFLVVVGELRG